MAEKEALVHSGSTINFLTHNWVGTLDSMKHLIAGTEKRAFLCDRGKAKLGHKKQMRKCHVWLKSTPLLFPLVQCFFPLQIYYCKSVKAIILSDTKHDEYIFFSHLVILRGLNFTSKLC